MYAFSGQDGLRSRDSTIDDAQDSTGTGKRNADGERLPAGWGDRPDKPPTSRLRWPSSCRSMARAEGSLYNPALRGEGVTDHAFFFSIGNQGRLIPATRTVSGYGR